MIYLLYPIKSPFYMKKPSEQSNLQRIIQPKDDRRIVHDEKKDQKEYDKKKRSHIAQNEILKGVYCQKPDNSKDTNIEARETKTSDSNTNKNKILKQIVKRISLQKDNFNRSDKNMNEKGKKSDIIGSKSFKRDRNETVLLKNSTKHSNNTRKRKNSSIMEKYEKTTDRTLEAKNSNVKKMPIMIDKTWIDQNYRYFMSTHVIAITGAGISTPDIPDFRSKDGLFVKIRQKHGISGKDCFDYRYSIEYETRSNYLRIMSELSQLIRKAKPNKIHHFLSNLKRTNRSFRLYDQNIDCLSERAGLSSINLNNHGRHLKGDIVYLHGKLDTLVCTFCGSKLIIDEKIEKTWEEGYDVECPRCVSRVETYRRTERTSSSDENHTTEEKNFTKPLKAYQIHHHISKDKHLNGDTRNKQNYDYTVEEKYATIDLKGNRISDRPLEGKPIDEDERYKRTSCEYSEPELSPKTCPPDEQIGYHTKECGPVERNDSIYKKDMQSGNIQKYKTDVLNKKQRNRSYNDEKKHSTRQKQQEIKTLSISRRHATTIGILNTRIIHYNQEHPFSSEISRLFECDLKKIKTLIVMGTSLKIPGVRDMLRAISKKIGQTGGVSILINNEIREAQHFDYIWKGEISEFVDHMNSKILSRRRSQLDPKNGSAVSPKRKTTTKQPKCDFLKFLSKNIKQKLKERHDISEMVENKPFTKRKGTEHSNVEMVNKHLKNKSINAENLLLKNSDILDAPFCNEDDIKLKNLTGQSLMYQKNTDVLDAVKDENTLFITKNSKNLLEINENQNRCKKYSEQNLNQNNNNCNDIDTKKHPNKRNSLLENLIVKKKPFLRPLKSKNDDEKLTLKKMLEKKDQENIPHKNTKISQELNKKSRKEDDMTHIPDDIIKKITTGDIVENIKERTSSHKTDNFLNQTNENITCDEENKILTQNNLKKKLNKENKTSEDNIADKNIRETCTPKFSTNKEITDHVDSKNREMKDNVDSKNRERKGTFDSQNLEFQEVLNSPGFQNRANKALSDSLHSHHNITDNKLINNLRVKNQENNKMSKTSIEPNKTVLNSSVHYKFPLREVEKKHGNLCNVSKKIDRSSQSPKISEKETERSLFIQNRINELARPKRLSDLAIKRLEKRNSVRANGTDTSTIKKDLKTADESNNHQVESGIRILKRLSLVRDMAQIDKVASNNPTNRKYAQRRTSYGQKDGDLVDSQKNKNPKGDVSCSNRKNTVKSTKKTTNVPNIISPNRHFASSSKTPSTKEEIPRSSNSSFRRSEKKENLHSPTDLKKEQSQKYEPMKENFIKKTESSKLGRETYTSEPPKKGVNFTNEPKKKETIRIEQDPLEKNLFNLEKKSFQNMHPSQSEQNFVNTNSDREKNIKSSVAEQNSMITTLDGTKNVESSVIKHNFPDKGLDTAKNIELSVVKQASQNLISNIPQNVISLQIEQHTPDQNINTKKCNKATVKIMEKVAPCISNNIAVGLFDNDHVQNRLSFNEIRSEQELNSDLIKRSMLLQKKQSTVPLTCKIQDILDESFFTLSQDKQNKKLEILLPPRKIGKVTKDGLRLTPKRKAKKMEKPNK